MTTEVKKTHRLFLDDLEYQAFERRLEWSPDGSVVLAPSACYSDLQTADSKREYTYTVFGFSRHQLSQPAFMLPGLKEYATCVRFHPCLFRTQNSATKLLDLPYQMLFAVATVDQVLIYSTEHQKPLALFSQLHFATINDLAWRGDRELELLACSSDGYVSIMLI